MADLSPIISEFQSAEDAIAHDVWFRVKVESALNSDKSSLPHDEVVAEAQAIVEFRRRAASRLAG